ncbi:addiction module toxin RelE [bacterium]|nr:MAG: addiction module toxin RelE [bacterium]
MTRPLRIEYPGAVYHITTRGNAYQDIFLDDADRERFLEILGQTIERFNWLCHAYCLMTNHYHLLIETVDPTLSRGMRQLNGVYTQAFNRRHERVGHVFQGRYKAILVEKEAYLLELARYIVLNPVRAKMVKSPKGWEWSSYRATAGLNEAPPFLTVDWILGEFSDEKKKAQRLYQKFVAGGIGRSPWDELRGQIYLGSERFIESVPKPRAKLTEIPRRQRLPDRTTLEEIFADAATTDEGILKAYRDHGYTMREIAEHLGVHYATVSRHLRKAERQENGRS